jgi:NAD(P)-dependent dehydrogenase (short-subunit alcohol dehydrogenase family)
MRPQPDHGEKSYEGSGKLKGKVALVTGADSGIGKAVAIAFSREGAHVVFPYLDEKVEGVDAYETVQLVEDTGQRAFSMPGDIRDENFCNDIVTSTIDEFGKLDILVNNAAFQMSYESIDKIPTDEFDRAFKTNVYGTFFMTRAAFPKMEPGSVIINTLSVQAYHPSSILLPYASTKGALRTFTEAFSQEAIKKGVRVNGIAPGPIWTPLIPSTMPNVEKFGESNPTGRPGQPAELAHVYVLLASDDASYINGEIWGVTGGAMAE